MDEITIQNLEVFAHHGVLPEEHVLGQKFIICTTLYTETRRAGKQDDLKQSIHYGVVSQDIKQWMETHTCQLIECVAEELCEMLLLKYEALKAIELEVKKPWAPVLLPLEYVSVKIKRGWNRVFLALGSNLGDRKQYLDLAVTSCKQRSDMRVKQVATYIETEPYGEYAKYPFLNSCIELETLMTAEELLQFCHEIEQKANREREIHWGPRTLDLDILLFNDEIICTNQLIIPHKEMEKRTFVLEPMCEIAPYVRHPISKKTMEQLLEEVYKM